MTLKPILLPTALLAALLLQACDKTPLPAAQLSPVITATTVSFAGNQAPPELRLAPVAPPSDHPVSLPGRLIWDEDHTVRVYAPYAGRIDSLQAEPGRTVARGAPLLVISSPDIGLAQADVSHAVAAATLASKALQRAQTLAAGGVIAGKDLEQAEADNSNAQAELTRARARLSQYGIGQQNVDQHLLLTAPTAGLVAERNANVGMEVRSDVQGKPLYIISDPTTLWGELDLTEEHLHLLKSGDPITLTTAAWPDETFAATVLSVGAAVDEDSRSVKARIKVPNADGRLKAQLFITAQVPQTNTLPTLSADAVFLQGKQQMVFVQLEPGRFERRAVQLRPGGPDAWLVVNGVQAGQQVVVGGALYLNQLLESAR